MMYHSTNVYLYPNILYPNKNMFIRLNFHFFKENDYVTIIIVLKHKIERYI